MRYISTRGQCAPVSGAKAILSGIAPDGGLFVPEQMPRLPENFCEHLSGLDYADRAAYLLSLFLPDFGDLTSLTRKAYSRFDGTPAPLVAYGGGMPYFLELWHGPTCAFKDMALQVLPLLVKKAMELTGENRDVFILTATSGDTGKAALEGFRDVPGTRVLVFYPESGVSEIQELQMVTQEGDNVGVCAVQGDFDDAQTGVKAVFKNVGAGERYLLTSANSINLGRLLPQIAYYLSAYVDYVRQYGGAGTMDVCVPTGNFGNILAALYAKRMGVPMGRLVCASNENNVLTGVIRDGVYDRNRPLVKTISPSMDILVSSNFERALYLLSGGDAEYVRICMENLASEGIYTLRPGVADALRDEMDGVWCGDDRAKACILDVYRRTGRVIDPHTATAAAVFTDRTNGMVVSTAHPGKFPQAVLDALGGSEFSCYTDVPQPLAAAQQKPRRFFDSVAPAGIEKYSRDFFGL